MSSPYPTTWLCNYCKQEHATKYQICPDLVIVGVKTSTVPVKNTVLEAETDANGKPTGRIGIYLPGVKTPVYTFSKVILWGLAGGNTEVIVKGDLIQNLQRERLWRVLDYKERDIGGTCGKDFEEARSNCYQGGAVSTFGDNPVYLQSDAGEIFNMRGHLIRKVESQS